MDLMAEFVKAPLENETEAQPMDGKFVGTITSQEPLH